MAFRGWGQFTSLERRLGDRLDVSQERGEVLLDGFPDVAFGLFDCFSVAEAAGDVWGISEVSVVLRLLLDDDLERVKFHCSSLCLPRFNSILRCRIRLFIS
jgi:hypothetical protein